MEYLLHWMHAYIVHFGVWMNVLIAFHVYHNGLPDPRKIPSVFKSAGILAIFISVLSSQAQTHIIKYFLEK